MPWAATAAAQRPVGAVQLVEVERQRTHGTVGFDERQRDDRLACPAGEVVDVQRRPRGQQHDLRRQRRHALPRPQPEQREPDVREHTRALEAALRADEARGRAHVLGVGRIAREAKRPVGLDRGRELAGAAVEVRPRAIGALLGADPSRRALRLLGLADSQELPQEHVLGVHRHVCLQLALPVALGGLEREQPLAGELQCHPGSAASLDGRRSHVRKARSFWSMTTFARARSDAVHATLQGAWRSFRPRAGAPREARA